MKTVNCPNCGAVVKADKNECPYCRTSYYDFTNIDMKKPAFLKLKQDDRVAVVKAVPTSATVRMYQENLSWEASDEWDWTPVRHCEICVTFEAV